MYANRCSRKLNSPIPTVLWLAAEKDFKCDITETPLDRLVNTFQHFLQNVQTGKQTERPWTQNQRRRCTYWHLGKHLQHSFAQSVVQRTSRSVLSPVIINLRANRLKIKHKPRNNFSRFSSKYVLYAENCCRAHVSNSTTQNDGGPLLDLPHTARRALITHSWDSQIPCISLPNTARE